MNRHQRRRKSPRRSGTPRWAVPCLVLAFSLLILGRTGGDAKFEQALRSVAGSSRFVTTALALEMGVYPKTTVAEHDPAPVAQEELSDIKSEDKSENPSEDSSENLSEDTAENTLPDTLVSESYFIPPNVKQLPLNSQPITEMTIKASASGSGYTGAQGVFIKNDAKLAVDVASMLKSPAKVTLKGSGPQVMLVHTHGTEAYTPDGKNYYTPDDNDRTQDKNYNVIRVGDEIEKVLTNMGIQVVHCRGIYDYPSYNGSYNRSLAAINEQMKKTPSIKMVIDIHRDAMISKTGVKYKTVSEVNGVKSSQLMLVMGSNAGGLSHDKWKTNLNFAVNLQNRINQKYPTLMRPVNLRAQRFNQHVTTGSMLLEVGTSGNTLNEALVAARAFAQELGNTLLGK